MPPNPSALEAVLLGILGVFVGTASLAVGYCQYRATTRLADVELGKVTQDPSASGTDAAMDAPETVNTRTLQSRRMYLSIPSFNVGQVGLTKR